MDGVLAMCRGSASKVQHGQREGGCSWWITWWIYSRTPYWTISSMLDQLYLHNATLVVYDKF